MAFETRFAWAGATISRIDAGARYGRMFDLPPLDADETLLHELGALGGFCDGEAEADSAVEAGWPFFGQ